MNIKIDDDESPKCYLCRRPYPMRKVHWKDTDTGLKLVELITHCCRCRSLLRKRKELQEKLLDVDWTIFTLTHTDYLDDD